MSKVVDVLCCGLATFDVIQYVADIPGPDQKVTSDHVLFDVGGPAANAARTASALGCQAAIVTALGRSMISKEIVIRLGAAGVHLYDARPPVTGWEPPVSAITVDSAGRRTVVSANAAAAPPIDVMPRDTPITPLLLVDGHHVDLAVTVAAWAKDRGALVLLDGGSWKQGLERLLPLVDVAVMSAAFLAPQDHRELVDRIPFRAITHGPDPIMVQSGPERIELAVPTVDAIDTMGAGDVLHGALAQRLSGIGPGELTGEQFVEALSGSAQLAARSCTRRGVMGWLD